MAQVQMSDAFAAAQYRGQGIAHFERNEFLHAIAAFDLALQLTPDDPYAKWNRATALLSIGEYERGFVEHDVAWRLFNWKGFSTIGDVNRISHLPLWRGESGVKVLAYHELGYGDAIMAMRFLPEVKRRAELVLVIDQCLTRLARGFDIEVADHLPDNVSGFDYRLPFFGVMSALSQTADSIPAAPYIGALNFPNIRKVSSIGIAWSGRTQTLEPA
jgi:tetratricopeptide (TPR) repeat protein